MTCAVCRHLKLGCGSANGAATHSITLYDRVTPGLHNGEWVHIQASTEGSEVDSVWSPSLSLLTQKL